MVALLAVRRDFVDVILKCLRYGASADHVHVANNNIDLIDLLCTDKMARW